MNNSKHSYRRFDSLRTILENRSRDLLPEYARNALQKSKFTELAYIFGTTDLIKLERRIQKWNTALGKLPYDYLSFLGITDEELQSAVDNDIAAFKKQLELIDAGIVTPDSWGLSYGKWAGKSGQLVAGLTVEQAFSQIILGNPCYKWIRITYSEIKDVVFHYRKDVPIERVLPPGLQKRKRSWNCNPALFSGRT